MAVERKAEIVQNAVYESARRTVEPCRLFQGSTKRAVRRQGPRFGSLRPVRFCGNRGADPHRFVWRLQRQGGLSYALSLVLRAIAIISLPRSAVARRKSCRSHCRERRHLAPPGCCWSGRATNLASRRAPAADAPCANALPDFAFRTLSAARLDRRRSNNMTATSILRRARLSGTHIAPFRARFAPVSQQAKEKSYRVRPRLTTLRLRAGVFTRSGAFRRAVLSTFSWRTFETGFLFPRANCREENPLIKRNMPSP